MRQLKWLFVWCSCLMILPNLDPLEAQSNVYRIDNPTELSNNREPIIVDNASDLELLTTWGLGTLADVTWIDNSHLAVASSAGTWLYDLTNPTSPEALITTLTLWNTGFNGDSPHLLISPDRQWLTVTPNFEQYGYQIGFEIWHIESGMHINLSSESDLLPQAGTVYQSRPAHVMWLSDGRLLTSYGSNVILWHISLTDSVPEIILETETISGIEYHIEQIDVSSDGQWIVVILRPDDGDQRFIQLWNTETNTQQLLYESVSNPEKSIFTQNVEFDPKANQVAVTVTYLSHLPGGNRSIQREIWRWDVSSGNPLEPFVIDCNSLGLSFADDYVLCSSEDFQEGKNLLQFRRLSDSNILGEVYEFSVPNGFQNLPQQDGYITVSNPATQSQPGSVGIWNNDGELVFLLDAILERVERVSLSPDGSQVALLERNQIQIWNIRRQSHQSTLEYGGLLDIINLEASPDGHYLISIGAFPKPIYSIYGTYSTRTVRWNLETGAKDIVPDQDAAFAVAYSPNGDQFVLGRHDGYLHVYDDETLELQSILINTGTIRHLSFSHDGRLLAVANDLYVRIWDMREQKVINRLTFSDSVSSSSGYRAFFEELLFTDDDKWLVFYGIIWKVEDRGHLIARWNPEESSEQARHLLNVTRETITQSYSPTKNLILASSPYSGTWLQELGASQSIWRYEAMNSDFSPEIWAVELNDDLVLVSSSDGVIRAFGIKSHIDGLS